MPLKNRGEAHFFVYILASRTRVLYVGVTNNLQRRIWEHKAKMVEGFTERYEVNRLVWFEAGNSALGAIAREKQIKGWRREKKVALIEAGNSDWKDLAEGWFPDHRARHPEYPSRPDS